MLKIHEISIILTDYRGEGFKMGVNGDNSLTTFL